MTRHDLLIDRSINRVLYLPPPRQTDRHTHSPADALGEGGLSVEGGPPFMDRLIPLPWAAGAAMSGARPLAHTLLQGGPEGLGGSRNREEFIFCSMLYATLQYIICHPAVCYMPPYSMLYITL